MLVMKRLSCITWFKITQQNGMFARLVKDIPSKSDLEPRFDHENFT